LYQGYIAKHNLLKLFHKFIFFRKFSTPAALIIHLPKSEHYCKVRRRDEFQTWISAVLTDGFGGFCLVSPDNADRPHHFQSSGLVGPFQTQHNGPEVYFY
jgi:hypothetical protein